MSLRRLFHVSPQAISRIDSIDSYNPFISHAFFSPHLRVQVQHPRATGWLPRHSGGAAKRQDRRHRAVLREKSFRRANTYSTWLADAFERAGGSYYPKLQASVPFTPATGHRLLIRGDANRKRISEALAAGLIALCNTVEASSIHVTFAQEDEWNFLGQHGFLQRTTSNSTGAMKGLSRLRGFSGLAQFTPPQGNQARAARCAGERHHHPSAHRSRHHRGCMGCVLRVLHGDRLAQMGPSLSEPRLLHAYRTDHAR